MSVHFVFLAVLHLFWELDCLHFLSLIYLYSIIISKQGTWCISSIIIIICPYCTLIDKFHCRIFMFCCMLAGCLPAKYTISNHYCFDILFQAGKVKSQETVLLPNLDRNQLMLQVEPLAGALVKTFQVHHDDVMIQKVVSDLICWLCSLHTFPSVSYTVFFLLNTVNFYKLSLSWLQLTKIITDAFWLWVSFLGNNCVASIFWRTVSALLMTGIFMKTL